MLGEICEWLGENLREVWGGSVSGWGEFARGLGQFCELSSRFRESWVNFIGKRRKMF